MGGCVNNVFLFGVFYDFGLFDFVYCWRVLGGLGLVCLGLDCLLVVLQVVWLCF